jgi:hypothetical protein
VQFTGKNKGKIELPTQSKKYKNSPFNHVTRGEKAKK